MGMAQMGMTQVGVAQVGSNGDMTLMGYGYETIYERWMEFIQNFPNSLI